MQYQHERIMKYECDIVKYFDAQLPKILKTPITILFSAE